MNTQAPIQFSPLAIVAGCRSPFAKMNTILRDESAVDLGVASVNEALHRANMTPNDVDEVILGNVSGPADAANISRVVSLKAGVPHDRPAHTVNRNCASGMESILSAWQTIRDGRAKIIVAGGTESMSEVPFLLDRRMQDWLTKLHRAKSWTDRMKLVTQLRPGMFRPKAGLELGLTDPVCGLNMGETAEVLAKEFNISRAEQDAFSLESHQRAAAAWERCFYGGEVAEYVTPSGKIINQDNGFRPQQSLEALAKLRPVFDRDNGTVTAGNSCSMTDGAAMVVLMSVEEAKRRELEPLGYLRAMTVAGCDPKRMGLGPVYAMNRLLNETGKALSDFDLFEINEAFAAQVLACLKASASTEFAKNELHRETALGEIPREQLNINGGAIALGHPVGTTGTRLILTMLRALKERHLENGLASLCVGGGQGAAAWLTTKLDI